jgi:hypothetical protein
LRCPALLGPFVRRRIRPAALRSLTSLHSSVSRGPLTLLHVSCRMPRSAMRTRAPVPTLAPELLATPRAAAPVVSLLQCVVVPSILFSRAHDDMHVCTASASLVARPPSRAACASSHPTRVPRQPGPSRPPPPCVPPPGLAPRAKRRFASLPLSASQPSCVPAQHATRLALTHAASFSSPTSKSSTSISQLIAELGHLSCMHAPAPVTISSLQFTQ